MKGKKTIIIFTDEKKRNVSAAIKESFRKNTTVQTIIISDKELKSYLNQFINNYFFKNESALKKTFSENSQKTIDAKVDKLPQQNVSYNAKKAEHRLTESIFVRYNPDIVVAATPGVLPALIAVRNIYKKPVKIAVVLDEYCLNKQVVYPQVDMYFVANDDVKKDLIECDIAEDKIKVTGLPVREKFKKTISAADARASFDFSDRPTFLICSTLSGDETFRKLIEDVKDAHLDANVIVACGYNRRLLAFVRENTDFYGINEGVDMNMAYSAADVVITRPTATVLAESLYKKKLIFTVFPKGTMEKRTADYLGLDVTVKHKSSEEIVRSLERYLLSSDNFEKTMYYASCAVEDDTELIALGLNQL